jgi:CHAT domain-containing protein/Tfp pilus assembly protein PilF
MKFYFLLFAFLICFTFSTSGQNYKKYMPLSYHDIDSLMYIEYGKSAFDKAIPFMQAGREKAAIDFGQQDSVFAEYTGNLGYFFYETGNYDKALPLLKEAVGVQEEVLGRNHPTVAVSLNNLALLYQAMGNYDKALVLYIKAKNIREKALGKNHPDFAQALNVLAILYKDMGNFDRALPLLLEAKDIREKALGKDHPKFAASLNNLAFLYQKMGNYNKALPLFRRAIDIKGKTLGKNHPGFAISLSNLAFLHQKMNNYDIALPFYIEASNIIAKALGENHPYFATTLNNLAFLHQNMHNFEEALPLFVQALDIREKVLGKDHPQFAKSLNNLAGLHKEVGNFERALPLLLQSKDITEKALGKHHPDYARPLNNLALLYEDMGNFDQAWNNLLQAINVHSGLYLTSNLSPLWTDSLRQAKYTSNTHLENMIYSLSYIYSLLAKDTRIVSAQQKQIIISDLAIDLLDKFQNSVSNEKDKLRVLAQSSAWLKRSLKVLTAEEHTNKAFHLSDQNKSVLLLQATKSEAAYRLGELPDSLIWQDKKMLKKQSKLEAKLLEKRPEQEKDSLRNILNNVNRDIDVFMEMVAKDYPKYHKFKYQQVNAKVLDIQALLDDNTVFIEYVLADSVVHIFCVEKQNVEWKKSFVGNKVLNNHVKALHQALSNYKRLRKDKEKAYREYSEQAYWFYQKLLAPILKNKENINNLILVTDGTLGHLPFEVFLVEQAPQEVTDYSQLHYLVKDYNISYNYSATLWKENMEASAPSNNGQILGVAANYDVKLDSSMIEVRLSTDQRLRDALFSLPAARKEVETLQEKYQGFFAFDALASEKTVKENVSNYAILHFATHGILNPERPVLSSLAFTEDSDSIESNFWQAHEISKIQLHADLVVLSACETGFGKFEKGNGIASLARAFMYAGASSLIVSLWQVNDYATSEIMKNLYGNLANGMHKDEALRQAKLQYMKTTKGLLAHPAFWSSFIQMGNTMPVIIKRKGGAMPWLIAGAMVLVLLGGFVMSRRKREVV